MRAAWLGAVWLAAVATVFAQGSATVPDADLGLGAGAQATVPDPGSTLPDEPAKGLVLVQCDHCHGLAWIERSGGTLEGWTDRVRRMNRAGAMIPEEQIPLIAAYLAKALPVRPRPPPDEEQGSSSGR